MSMVKVIFIRQTNRQLGSGMGRSHAVSVEPRWEELGTVHIDSTELPRVGDFVHIPMNERLTIGSIVEGVSWSYNHACIPSNGNLFLEKVEIKVQ